MHACLNWKTEGLADGKISLQTEERPWSHVDVHGGGGEVGSFFYAEECREYFRVH